MSNYDQACLKQKWIEMCDLSNDECKILATIKGASFSSSLQLELNSNDCKMSIHSIQMTSSGNRHCKPASLRRALFALQG